MDAEDKTARKLDPAEMGALAHLYRAEVYRSTIWRTRLDTTTNWSVVTLGVALSITYSSPQASPLPLVLVGILIIFFLMLEARRYRYFNVWRARCRWMELHFFAPMLKHGDLDLAGQWRHVRRQPCFDQRRFVLFRGGLVEPALDVLEHSDEAGHGRLVERRRHG